MFQGAGEVAALGTLHKIKGTEIWATVTESLCKLFSTRDKYINKKYGNFVRLNRILITPVHLPFVVFILKKNCSIFKKEVYFQPINQIKYLDISNLSM